MTEPGSPDGQPTESENYDRQTDTQPLAVPARSPVDDDTPPLSGQEIRRIRELLDQSSTRELLRPDDQADDETIYWDDNPHLKYFLKRLWRIVAAWLVVVAIVAVAVWQTVSSGSFWWLIGPVPAVAAGWWYTLRRLHKWRHLRLRVKGNWFFIEEPRHRFYLLNGQRQGVPLIKCDNSRAWQTKLELMIELPCGTLDIDSPIDKGDKFRNLTDVRNHEQLLLLIQRRYDALLLGSTGAAKQQLGGSSPSP